MWNFCSSNCTTLTASVLEVGETTTYSASSIPYNPPYQFQCLTNPIFINDDDVWSPVIDFSSNNFDFCFYGNTYNVLWINDNGTVSFDQAHGAFTAQGFPFNTGGVCKQSFTRRLIQVK